MAHYKSPDYCFITRRDTLSILLLELGPLFDQKGVFYSIYNPINGKADYKEEEEELQADDHIRVVIFFDDAMIDTKAEEFEVPTRLKQFNCLLPFKQRALKLFDQFNSRQLQFIVTETLRSEIDFEFLKKSKVILEHFPVHMP